MEARCSETAEATEQNQGEAQSQQLRATQNQLLRGEQLDEHETFVAPDMTHSSAILGLRVAFLAPSSEQGIGGWLEGRISGVALNYRQIPGVLSVVTLAVTSTSFPAKDPFNPIGLPWTWAWNVWVLFLSGPSPKFKVASKPTT